MNLLTELLPFGDVLGKVFDRVFPNPEDKAKAQLEVLRMNQAGEFRVMDTLDKSDENQAKTNQVEAASASFWVSGWRPAVGWVCALGLFAQFFAVPLLAWVAANVSGWSAPPSLELGELITLLIGMLGLSGIRSFDKLKRTS